MTQGLFRKLHLNEHTWQQHSLRCARALWSIVRMRHWGATDFEDHRGRMNKVRDHGEACSHTNAGSGLRRILKCCRAKASNSSDHTFLGSSWIPAGSKPDPKSMRCLIGISLYVQVAHVLLKLSYGREGLKLANQWRTHQKGLPHQTVDRRKERILTWL